MGGGSVEEKKGERGGRRRSEGKVGRVEEMGKERKLTK